MQDYWAILIAVSYTYGVTMVTLFILGLHLTKFEEANEPFKYRRLLTLVALFLVSAAWPYAIYRTLYQSHRSRKRPLRKRG